MDKMKKHENIIIAIIISNFNKVVMAVKSRINIFKDKLQLNVNDKDGLGYIDLGPTDDAKNISEHLKALEWALSNKKITNIAISGPYGAGKSSVINTFVKKHPSIKYINISLASFRYNKPEIVNDQNVLNEFEKQLEEGILKQLFYKIHYSKIPQSRYRKLHKVSFWKNFLHVVFAMMLFLCFAILLAPAKLSKLTKIYYNEMTKLFGWNLLEQCLFVAGIVIVIILIVTTMFMWINTKWKSVELNIADKAVIKADEKGDVLSINKNMDEILYFFEETNYKVVFIEDLDRFNTPEVYTKLREINKIINDYDAIHRRIVFVYTLRDDVFHNEDRTKFFDFIIPVVPYIDATNSGEYLKNRLKELDNVGLKFTISKEYIINISPFISDMRLLNNICNEFIVFKKTIKDGQNLEKLKDEQMFSIMVFKNMYPEEFAKLQESGGLILKAYKDRSNFIEQKTKELKGEIIEAEEKKKQADSNEILGAEDVKLAFIMKLVEDKGVFVRIQGSKGTYSKSDMLKEDFSLAQIGNGRAIVFYRYSNSYGNELSSSINNIEMIKCSDGITYFEKCDRAISRDKNIRNMISQNVLNKQNELYLLRSKTINDLIKEYGTDEILCEEILNNKLLVFLLRHGYIDDTYQMYINYFIPGSITSDEQNFIINVRYYGGKQEWNYKIMHPQAVLSRLFDYELEQQKECLNFDLADYLYLDEKSSDKKIGFTKQLAKPSEDSKNFIKEYYTRAKNKIDFIKNLTQQKPLFWYDICSDDSIEYQVKIAYLKDIFEYVKTEDIVLQDTAANEEDPLYSIRSFIIESEDVLTSIQEAGADKVIEVLIRINTKMKTIDLKTVNPTIIQGIYENKLFEIALPMLQKYADFKAGEPVLDFKNNIFTHILRLGDSDVIEYLEQNINEFVSKVMLETEANTEENVDTIIRCIRLLDYDEELSINLIHKMNFVLDDLQDWISSTTKTHKEIKGIVDSFLKENKLKATFKNFDTFKKYYEISPELCDFVDENIEVLLSDKNIDDVHVKDLLKTNINDITIEKVLQNYKIDSFNDSLNLYGVNVVRYMILLKYFQYTRSRYNEILSKYPNMLPLFVKCYWDEFKQEIPSIPIDISTIDIIFKSDLDDDKKAVLLNKVDTSRMSTIQDEFVRNTNVNIPKKYLLATWNRLNEEDRPELLVNHFSEFNIDEIENMFLQMPKEYSSLKQEDGRHEVLLEKNNTNAALCKKLKDVGYISSYDLKTGKNISVSDDEKYVVRVKARRQE